MRLEIKKMNGTTFEWRRLNPRLPISFVIIFLILFIIATFETILTIVEGNKIFRKSISEIRTIRLKEHQPEGRFVVSPDIYYLETTDSLQKKMYWFELDERGFVTPSRIHENPDLEMVFLGGSTTECMFVNDKKRFPYLVGRMLEERSGKKINSYNGGVSGNHSLHSINILINKVLPMKPDIVLMCHNVNDLNILLYEGTYWNSNPTRSPIETIEIKEGEDAPTLIRRGKNIVRALIPHLYERMHVLKKQWMARGKKRTGDPEFDEFAHLRGKKITFDSEALLAEFTRNLKLFVDIVRDSGSIPVLITQANRFTDNPDPVILSNMQDLADMGIEYAPYKTIYDRFNQAIRDVGSEKGVLVIDLERAIPKESLYMYDTMHFNDVGSEKAAELITESLLPQVETINKKMAAQ